MPPVHPSDLLLSSACVRLRDGRRIEFEEEDSCGTLCHGSLFVIASPYQSLLIYALLLTMYLFAICSTDVWFSFFEFLKQK